MALLNAAILAKPYAKIVGGGSALGGLQPSIIWGATTVRLDLAAAGTVIQGMSLQMNGVNTIAEGIRVTGANVSLLDNTIVFSGPAAALHTLIILTTGAAVTANDLTIARNFVTGTLAGDALTDGFLIDGAVRNLKIVDNLMWGPSAVATGFIHFSAAALHSFISRNTIVNETAASTACIASDAVATTGVISYNSCATYNNGVAANQGIVLAGGSLFRCFQNYDCDEPVASGALNPAVCAT
jgi:hypothetical protein